MRVLVFGDNQSLTRYQKQTPSSYFKAFYFLIFIFKLARDIDAKLL